MPPTPITFSFHADSSVGGGVKGGSRIFTVQIKTPAPSLPEPTKHANPAPLSASKKRKAAPPIPAPTSEHLSSVMTPLNVTIVARCLAARHTVPSPPASTKKRSGNHTPAASPTPPSGPAVHPYSRSSDLANTRSTVPSPQELARAERAEEEKARQKKENAAAARAAAALARRRKALRSGRGASRMPSASVTPASMIPPIQRAVAAQRARSAEAAAKEAQAAEKVLVGMAVTAEPEDDGSDAGLPAARSLKRTRSSGLLNIATNGSGSGSVSAASPLRTVTTTAATGGGGSAAGDDSDKDAVDSKDALADTTQRSPPSDSSDAPARKRSRLAESLPARVPSSRRANSASPTGSASSLPEQTTPRKAAALGDGADAPDAPISPTDATTMRRVVSATDTAGLRRGGVPRNASVGPDSLRERSRREVQLPARLRD